MKKLNTLFCFLAIIILFSCKKDDSTQSLIIGNWELSRQITGVTGQNNVIPAGNGTIIKFTKSNYQKFENNQLKSSGTYQIVKEVSLRTNQTGDRIIYDNDKNSLRIFISVSDTQLDLFIDAYDAGGASYRKVN